MKIRNDIVTCILLGALPAACDGSAPSELAPPELAPDDQVVSALLAPDHVLARQRLAASGQYSFSRTAEIGVTAASDLAAALDIPAGLITSASLQAPDPEAALDLPNLGVIQPRRGASLVALSTGRIRVNPPPEPGTDFGAVGTTNDIVLLRIGIDVPRGASRLSFDFNFLSAEAPDFVGSEFNDTFVARVIDGFGTREIARASVNSSFFFDASDSRAGGTGFVLFVDDPAGVDFAFGPGEYPADIQLFPDAGITDFQPVNVAVASGGAVVLELEIRDLGDGILDSTVLIDNVTFSAIEALDPNPELIDELDGTVVTDAAELARHGTPVNAVAADGVTPVLLRVGVPGPGQVTFSVVDGGDAAANGGLSAVGGSGRAASVAVAAEQATPGQFYAFAIYQAPDSFHRGAAHPEDEAAARRTVRLRAAYTPATGTGFQHEHELKIVRPPVVVVHDIWQGCVAWSEADILTDARFHTGCADYTANNAAPLNTNRRAVPDAIFDVVEEMRTLGIAVTQADVVGHGMGGLLARKYVDALSYERFTNLNQGDINRLITMNTPHLGTRMADEIVAFREGLQASPDPTKWPQVRNALLAIGINIDDGTAIDELQSNSAVINGIGTTQIPSHVMFSGGALAIPRTNALPLDAKLRVLYPNMEAVQPCPPTLPPAQCAAERRKFIYGSESKVFCTDDHDLFVTERDQTSGLTGSVTSRFSVTAANTNSAHFLVVSDTAHLDSLFDLLDTSVTSPIYAPSLPSPASVPRLNSCTGGSSIPLAGAREQQAAEPVHSLADGTLQILEPAAGTPVSPGSTVSVVVQPEGGFEPEVLFLLGAGHAVVLEQQPFVADFPIPENAIGEVSLTAFGIDFQGNVAVSAPVSLPVALAADLVAMRLLGGDANLPGPGSTHKLIVLGDYSDGVTRDVSSPATGTVYSSSNTAVATVSSNGLVTAASPGIATLVARNGAAVTSISVTVADGGVSPEAVCRDVTVDADASCQAQASIDGGSHDPDELPQPLVVVQTPPGPFGLGVHTVNLAVSDGADSDTCSATVTVVDKAAPALAGCDDITVEATPGLGGAYVSYAVTGTDNCEGRVPVTCDVPPGSFFGMGESVPVTCTSADSGGHQATCTFAVQVQEPTTCDASTPEEQDYWRTQCNYRGADGTPPDPFLTADILQRLLDQVEADVQDVCEATESTCQALNPYPFWDACEQACQHYTAWLLNIASARVPSACCNFGGTAATAAAHVADLIAAGQCAEAITLAYDLNRGCVFCDGQP